VLQQPVAAFPCPNFDQACGFQLRITSAQVTSRANLPLGFVDTPGDTGGSIPVCDGRGDAPQVLDSVDRLGGEPRRNRTYNPQIKSLLLCQLS
jgi:hypothetical protein